MDIMYIYPSILDQILEGCNRYFVFRDHSSPGIFKVNAIKQAMKEKKRGETEE
jgi:hypothetical protein